MRNRCLSTASDKNAKRWPSGEKDDRAVICVVSCTAGCDIVAVDTGRLLGGFGVLVLFFFKGVAILLIFLHEDTDYSEENT